MTPSRRIDEACPVTVYVPMHTADRIVIRASALALVALVVIFAMEFFQ